jgi:uncharacterized protein
MNPYDLIAEFYRPGSRSHRILVRHGEQVAEKALAVARRLARGDLNMGFIAEAALVHDIGVFLTRAPGIGCTGNHPYVCHGYLGRNLLDRKGLRRHARVCERHVGVGISIEEIIARALPLPRRDMRPVTLEEQIIAYADKFYSKGGEAEKRVPEILRNLERYGADKAALFRSWVVRFEGDAAADLQGAGITGP